MIAEDDRKRVVATKTLWRNSYLVHPVALIITPEFSEPWKKYPGGKRVSCRTELIGNEEYTVRLFATDGTVLEHIQFYKKSIVIAGDVWRYRNGRDIGVHIVEGAQVAIIPEAA